MVGDAIGEGLGDAFMIVIARDNIECTLIRPQRGSSQVKVVAGQEIQLTHELTCVVVDLLVAFFEFVQLLQDDNRQIDVVLLKVHDAIGIVQHHVGVEDKILLGR